MLSVQVISLLSFLSGSCHAVSPGNLSPLLSVRLMSCCWSRLYVSSPFCQAYVMLLVQVVCLLPFLPGLCHAVGPGYMSPPLSVRLMSCCWSRLYVSSPFCQAYVMLLVQVICLLRFLSGLCHAVSPSNLSPPLSARLMSCCWSRLYVSCPFCQAYVMLSVQVICLLSFLSGLCHAVDPDYMSPPLSARLMSCCQSRLYVFCPLCQAYVMLSVQVICLLSFLSGLCHAVSPGNLSPVLSVRLMSCC